MTCVEGLFRLHAGMADLHVLPGGRPCELPRRNGIPRVSAGDFRQLSMWLTCMYCQGVGHVGFNVKTTFHGCQQVIFGNCQCG